MVLSFFCFSVSFVVFIIFLRYVVTPIFSSSFLFPSHLAEESKTYVIPNQKSLWEATAKLIEYGQERFLIVDRAEGDVEIQSHTEPFVDGMLL
jgi:hypothetical protein